MAILLTVLAGLFSKRAGMRRRCRARRPYHARPPWGRLISFAPFAGGASSVGKIACLKARQSYGGAEAPQRPCPDGGSVAWRVWSAAPLVLARCCCGWLAVTVSRIPGSPFLLHQRHSL